MSGRTFYMQRRYYDPIASRFLSMDPVSTDAGSGASFNRYAYVNNNPYKYTDPNGEEAAIPELPPVTVWAPRPIVLAQFVRGLSQILAGPKVPALGLLTYSPSLGAPSEMCGVLSCGMHSEGAKSPEDLIGESTPGDKTKGRADQYIHEGGREQRDKDIDALGVTDMKDRGNGTKTGTLPDGRTVNVHDSSKGGVPTIEIGNGSRDIKIRYP
jgi:RHS repeat-associated protein